MTTAWPGTEPLRVSNSEIQTWKRCHRKWYLSHFLAYGLPSDHAEIGPRSIGVKIHVVMDRWYGVTVPGYDGPPVDPVAEIRKLYDEEVERFPNAAPALTKEKDLAVAMVEGYVAWLEETGVDEFLAVTATEANLEVDGPVPNVKLRGRLDQRITRSTDGARLFLDHKTKPSIEDQFRLLPLDEQMKFYALLEFLHALQETGAEPPERTDGGLYNVMRRVKRTANAKPPFYERIEVRHNKETLRSMWLRVQRVLEEIIEARLALADGGDHRYWAYPRPDDDCKWKCPFISICPMMDDGSNWQGLLDEHYVHVDPYERYGDGLKEDTI